MTSLTYFAIKSSQSGFTSTAIGWWPSTLIAPTVMLAGIGCAVSNVCTNHNLSYRLEKLNVKKRIFLLLNNDEY